MERKNVILTVCVALLFANLACGLAIPTTATLPVGETTAVPPAGVTAAPPAGATVPAEGKTQLPITPGVAHVTDTGFLKISGSVENRTGAWIGLIIINVKLYDKDNNLLMATSTTGETDQVATVDNGILAPGETGYFMYLRDITHIQGTFDHFELSASANEVPERVQAKASDVNIGPLSETFVEVSGNFSNVSQTTCFKPAVVAIGYTADGKIYEVESSYPEDQAGAYLSQMEPGQKAPFKFSIENENQHLVKIDVVAGCNVQ